MKFNVFLAACMCVLALAASPLPARAQNSPPQDVEMLQKEIARLTRLIADLRIRRAVAAQSYVVLDLSTGLVISQRNMNQALPIASLTKMMNAVVALEHIDADRRIVLSASMLKPLGFSPSLFLHAAVSARDLLRASLIQSTNDASEALAHIVGTEKFISLMNQKAGELGMANTSFRDAHGLSLANRSTAADMAKMLQYIRDRHPDILDISKENDFWLPDATGKLLKFQNVNNFFEHPEFIGGKAGYLPKARQSLASLFMVRGRLVAVVLLSTPSRQADGRAILDVLQML